jgi:hypothetical protein
LLLSRFHLPNFVTSSRPLRRTLGTAAALCGVLVAACAPERIPGSPVTQGDAGIAFRAELATANGAGLSSRGPTSGASYGGGSSSSSRGSALLLSLAPGHLPGGTACDWFNGAETPGMASVAPPGWDATKGVGMDGWFEAHCIAPGEVR